MAARFLLPAAEVAESLLTIDGKRQYRIVPMPAADEGGTA